VHGDPGLRSCRTRAVVSLTNGRAPAFGCPGHLIEPNSSWQGQYRECFIPWLGLPFNTPKLHWADVIHSGRNSISLGYSGKMSFVKNDTLSFSLKKLIYSSLLWGLGNRGGVALHDCIVNNNELRIFNFKDLVLI